MTAFAHDSETEALLLAASQGSEPAAERLLARHRLRLKQMVSFRLNSRLLPRIDPSDVVQDALLEAHRRLPGYLETRPLPFYPWLRQLAWDKLVDQHRRHLLAERRTVSREVSIDLPCSEASAAQLVDALIKSGTSPSHRMLQHEIRDRVRQALDQLAAPYREVLVLRFLEQLSTEEAAAVQGVTVSALKTRQLRALERLRTLLGSEELS